MTDSFIRTGVAGVAVGDVWVRIWYYRGSGVCRVAAGFGVFSGGVVSGGLPKTRIGVPTSTMPKQ